MDLSVVDDGVKIRRVVIKPTVFLGIGRCSIAEEELWLRPRASPVLRQRYPDFTAIPHAVHGAAQPRCIVSLCGDYGEKRSNVSPSERWNSIGGASGCTRAVGVGVVQLLPSSVLRASHSRPVGVRSHEIDLAAAQIDGPSLVHAK